MHEELSVKSRVRGDFHARFCERVRVKLPRSTRPCTAFAVYHSQTAPLIDWYKAEGLHHYVKSYGVLEEIFADVCKVVDSL